MFIYLADQLCRGASFHWKLAIDIPFLIVSTQMLPHVTSYEPAIIVMCAVCFNISRSVSKSMELHGVCRLKKAHVKLVELQSC